MKVLGISTSTPQIGVALGDAGEVTASSHVVMGRRHAELVMPMVTAMCASADVAFDDIGVVAVDVGPGLFTGLRVGVTSAVAFAAARGIPMITTSSLDLMAFAVRRAARTVTSVLDARRGELFVASYLPVPGGVQRTGEQRVVSPSDLAAELVATRDDHLLVGNGALRYAEMFESLDHVELGDAGEAYPSAAALVQLAHAKAMREDWIAPTDVRCDYLRQPDAQINWETRDAGTR